MPAVRDLMTRDVITISPDLTLRDALEFLALRHIGGAPVVAAGKLIGVISTADLLTFQASAPVVPALGPHQTEQGELEPPGEWEEGSEAPAAYFTDLWADVGADTVERFRTLSGPEWDLLEEHTVSEAMSRAVLTIAPDADITDAARAMVRAQVHRLLVLDGGRLAGIVTTWDLVKALAERGV